MTEAKQRCMNCLNLVPEVTTAIYKGVYYTDICRDCLNAGNEISGNVQSFNRRRDWEDNAVDTIQPYTASGPNLEFFRNYPAKARKMFSATEIAELERKI